MLPECLERLQSESELEYNPDDRSLTEEEIIAGVKGKDGLIVMAADPVGSAIMDANPELKIIANFGVGYDRLDVAAATARGIPITNTPDVVTEATADMAWALLMAAGRRIAEGDRFIRARRWVTTSPRLFLGLDIAGATLGLLGLGRIGKAMIPRAKGFGMTINYWNRTRLPESEEERLGIQYVEKEALFSESDFVSIHVALNQDTTHLVGEAELALMNMFFLRGGYKSLFREESEAGITAGMGFAIGMAGGLVWNADYTFMNYGLFDDIHMFAVAVSF